MFAVWRHQDEGRDHQESEQQIGCHEHPAGGIVLEDALQPAGDEAGVVAAAPQPVLRDGERTNGADQCFGSNEQHCGHVHYAKEGIANDPPTAQGADPDERQAADNERHEQGVDQENESTSPHTSPGDDL